MLNIHNGTQTTVNKIFSLFKVKFIEDEIKPDNGTYNIFIKV